MYLLHDHAPDHVPAYGDWVCSCQDCWHMVVAHTSDTSIDYVIKAQSGRKRVTGAQLVDILAAGSLDEWTETQALGGVREVFVAPPPPSE